jgi:hypothetical protein
MSRLLWELRHIIDRLGRIGWMALMLLVLAVCLYLLKVRPYWNDLSAREQVMEARQAALVALPEPAVAEAVDESQADRRFTLFLRELVMAAEQHKIELPEVNYQQAREDDDKLEHYLVQVEFQASYPQARAFLGHVRRRPGARLERLVFTREDIGTTVLKTELDVSYLVALEPAL